MRRVWYWTEPCSLKVSLQESFVQWNAVLKAALMSQKRLTCQYKFVNGFCSVPIDCKGQRWKWNDSLLFEYIRNAKSSENIEYCFWNCLKTNQSVSYAYNNNLEWHQTKILSPGVVLGEHYTVKYLWSWSSIQNTRK